MGMLDAWRDPERAGVEMVALVAAMAASSALCGVFVVFIVVSWCRTHKICHKHPQAYARLDPPSPGPHGDVVMRDIASDTWESSARAPV